MHTLSRNQPCPCGSGKKYKHCCGKSAVPPNQEQRFQGIVKSALARHQAGDWESVLPLYDQALEIKPGDPGLLGLKGMALYQMGSLREARALIEKALEAAPNDARLHNYYGQVLEAEDESGEAALEFVQAVRLQPNYFEAWHNAGRALLKRRKASEAVYALTNALKLQPNDANTLLDMTEACFLERKLDEAEIHLARLKNMRGFQARALLWVSALLVGRERGEEASAAEADALEHVAVAEELFDTMVKIARVELHVGNLKEAEHWLAKSMALRPESSLPYVELAVTRKFSPEDQPLVDKMESLSGGNLAIQQRRGLEFALGKVYADLQAYDEAFRHYKDANDLVRQLVPFDIENYRSKVGRLINTFSTEFVSRIPPGSDSSVPILIVGTPRSGTTLTESIVSSHSTTAGAGEVDYWNRVMPHVMDAVAKGREIPESLSRRIADEYLMFLRQHSREASRITDKMPGNYQHLGVIHAIFPNAKIIHTKRHPIDACLSIYFQNFSNTHAYKWDLGSLAMWYEQYQRLMAHWRTVLPTGGLYEIQYEKLVEDQEGESRKLLDFLGLDWEDEVLEFHKQDRSVFTASKWQVRQPVYKTSKERWRAYEKHLGPLMDLLKYAPL